VTTPSWSIVHLIGSGDEFTVSGKVNYPNGETWYGVILIPVRDGKMWRETRYYAEPFEVPAWRAEWSKPVLEEPVAG